MARRRGSMAEKRFQAFLVFSGVFSWAHFILMASIGMELALDLQSFWTLGILVSALGMAMNPSRIIWAGSHAFFWVAFSYQKAPGGPNHLFLMCLISVGIFIAVCLQSLFELKSKSFNREKTFMRLIAFGRWQVLIVYFFAVFHKLNADFFNTESSCAVAMALNIVHHLPGLSDHDSIPYPMVIIVSTLALEAIIPILLVFPAARFWGVLTGLWFHSLLSMHPNLYVLSFTYEIQAIYMLFIPIKIIERAKEDGAACLFRLGQPKVFNQIVLGMAALVFLGFSMWIGHGEFAKAFRNILRLIWFGWVTMMSAYLIWNRYYRKNEYVKSAAMKESSPWIPGLLLTPIVLLTFFNGCTPYIGWKTNTNFSMFSNLRTETSTTNHLLLPRSFGGWTSAEKMVMILEANDPYLTSIRNLNETGREWYVPEVLVRRRATLGQDGNFTVVVKRLNGEVEYASRSTEALKSLQEKEWKENPKLIERVSLFERKFIDFRPIPLDGKPIPCLH